MALRTRLARPAAAAALGLALLLSAAAGGERDDDGLFGKPPPTPAPPQPGPRPRPLPPAEIDVEPPALPPRRAQDPGLRRRWMLSLDFDYRRRKLRPVKVDDEFHDFVGNVHFDERLDLGLYSSGDLFQIATLGLTLHWYALEKLDIYASLRRPVYGKGQHREIEYDGAPIASPRLELDHGASLEVAAGFEWEALRISNGPLKNFGLTLAGEARVGWADDIKSPNQDTEFDIDGNDEIEYDADWQAFDTELRVFRFFPHTREGSLTVYAGAGASFMFYHEEWDGEFENGDETEKLVFDYREEHAAFGSFGMRAEKGRLRVEVGARYGGESLLHVSAGWKF